MRTETPTPPARFTVRLTRRRGEEFDAIVRTYTARTIEDALWGARADHPGFDAVPFDLRIDETRH